MDVIFSEKALSIANTMARNGRTQTMKMDIACIAEDHLAGCALYLGAANGPRSTAIFLFQLAEHFSGLPDAALPTDPQWREWK